MQVAALLLLVLALALLVLGLISGSTPLVLASIAASLVAAYAMVRYRRQAEFGAGSVPAADRRTGAEPAVVADGARAAGTSAAPHDGAPEAGAPEAGASEAEAPEAGAEASVAAESDRDFSYDDEPAAALTEPPLQTHPDEPVWVIDGRPRYHLSSCIFIIGRRPEPVSLGQAVEDGFSPCAQCDPDTGLVAG